MAESLITQACIRGSGGMTAMNASVHSCRMVGALRYRQRHMHAWFPTWHRNHHVASATHCHASSSHQYIYSHRIHTWASQPNVKIGPCICIVTGRALTCPVEWVVHRSGIVPI